MLLTDHEFKKLLMDMSSRMLESVSDTHQKHAVKIVGKTSSVKMNHTGYFPKQFSSPVMEYLRVMSHHLFGFNASSIDPTS